ncbi:MAG: flavodoxin family protein [Moorellales bacterium]
MQDEPKERQPKILVVYHSQTGNTRKMAEAVAQGAEQAGAAVFLKPSGEADLTDLLACDGLAIGTPEYFGYMAGMVKDFFDRVYEGAVADPRLFRKPYILFISAGNDGAGARLSVERICTGLKLRKVQEVLIAKGPVTEEILTRCRELGAALALGIQARIF